MSNNNPNPKLEIKRHSLEHVMVLAYKRLYGDDVLLGVGPVIENGFYQDFEILPNRKGNHEVVEGLNPQSLRDSSSEGSIGLKVSMSESDFPKIEEEMKKIISEGLSMIRQEIPIQEAIEYFESKGQKYKVELLKDIQSKGSSKMKDEAENQVVADMIDSGNVSFYYFTKPSVSQSETPSYKEGSHVDLCRGPHVANTKELKDMAFKLDRIAGSYWRGSEKNPMLTRIYAIAFDSKEELDNYYKLQEEAKKRDHKILGQKLDIFVFSDLVGSGLPLWTPNGTIMRNLLDEFVWSLRSKYNYQKVEIPHITKKDLYVTSGHWEKYQNDLFKITTREGHEFCMKPMNCPHHTQIYARKLWSYKELPQRYANTTTCYRDEQSGELSGLSRVRAFAQDDAHVFCRITQAKEEMQKIWNIVHDFYSTFDLKLKLRLSLRDLATPEKYLGDKEHWDKAEQILKEIAKENNTEYYEGIGEAAFYAPKLDFMANDSLGREWQVATIQLDVNMPNRFDLYCINEKGEQERIVMIHAAIMGSLERFMSIMIEHFAGAFPLWLSPVQVVIVPVSNEKHGEYAKKVINNMLEQNIRVEIYDENETLGNRIRKAKEMKVNYIVVVGDKEIEANSLNIRNRKDEQENMKIEDFVGKLSTEIKEKRL